MQVRARCRVQVRRVLATTPSVLAPAWVALFRVLVGRVPVVRVLVVRVRDQVDPVVLDLVDPVAQALVLARVDPVVVVALVGLAVPVAPRVPVAAQVVRVAVLVRVAVALPPAHSASPAANRVRVVRASAPSAKSGTTCKRRCSACNCLAVAVKPFVCHAVRR